MTVSVTEAKNRLTELLVKVEQGERIVIQRHGQPIAEINRPEPQRKPKFGTMKGAIKEIDPDWHRPQDDAEAWIRGDV